MIFYQLGKISILKPLLKFQAFQTGFFGQKEPQSDKHKKKTPSFLGQINLILLTM
jgi:hypothetical protein